MFDGFAPQGAPPGLESALPVRVNDIRMKRILGYLKDDDICPPGCYCRHCRPYQWGQKEAWLEQTREDLR